MDTRSAQIPLKVAILWHMHQPNYREPHSNRLAMPWVRFHALKDYLDMPLLAASFDRIRVTFNLVPSLLDQIEMYVNGATDRHLELSRMRAEDLTPGLKVEILETFFSANPDHLIKPFHRYWELYNKARREDANRLVLASFFSSAEMRDLQVWSNLAWVDPMFRNDPIIKDLVAREKQYTEEEKHRLLDWQIEHMKRIIPTYRRLLDEQRIDISFTPYFHPILPLLCDTDVAREAMPDIQLPPRRFRHHRHLQQRGRDRRVPRVARRRGGLGPARSDRRRQRQQRRRAELFRQGMPIPQPLGGIVQCQLSLIDHRCFLSGAPRRPFRVPVRGTPVLRCTGAMFAARN